jgi:transposase InsO family protein
MIAFIDDHRDAYGVEPICRVLPIAPSTYYEHVAQRQDPSRLSARAREDLILKPEIARVFAENFAVYGVRKVWRQMMREGFVIARCTVERLMHEMGLAGVILGKPVRTTISDKAAPCPRDHVNRLLSSSKGLRASAEQALGVGLHLCRDLGRVRLRRLRHRYLRQTDRRLARQQDGARQLRPGCARTGAPRSPSDPSGWPDPS